MQRFQDQAKSFLRNYPKFAYINTPAVRRAYSATIEQIIINFLTESGLSFLIDNEPVLAGMKKEFQRVIDTTKVYFMLQSIEVQDFFNGMNEDMQPLFSTTSGKVFTSFNDAKNMQHALWHVCQTQIITLSGE
jgi:hypothetical protein